MQDQCDFNLAQHFCEINRARPDKPAFIDDHEILTYADFEVRLRGVATSLDQLSSHRSLKIMISVSDCIDLPIMIAAGLLGGHTVIMCNPNVPPAVTRNYVDLCAPDIIVTTDAAKQGMQHLVQGQGVQIPFVIGLSDARTMWHRKSDDLRIASGGAVWVFTSGGGDRSKIVMHTDRTLHAAAVSMARDAGITSQDVIYVTSKMSFSYGSSYSFYCNLLCGATAVVRSGMPTAHAVIDTARRYRPSVFASIPKIYNTILNSGLDLADLGMRICISAGEPLPAGLDTAWKQHTNTDIYDMYGLSELHAMALCNRPDDKKTGTAGKPAYGTECLLRNEQGEVCQTGELGQLFVKCASQAVAYHNDVESSAKTFQGSWVATGDRFVQDSDGFYSFVGRVNDMFKIDARWVSPIEIENVLMQDESVKEAGVTSKPDHDGLAEIVAVVVLKSHVPVAINLEHRLKKLVKKKLEPYKAPKSIIISNELPRNPNGKLLRHLL